MNMSLGGNPIAGNCDGSNPAWTPVLDSVVAAGVTVVASSGNEFASTGVSAPACLTDTVAVGALTSNFSTVAAYSNSGSMLDIVAPGTSINSTDEGGGYLAATGTSMASPHVAGAVAVLKSAAPCLTPAQVRDALDQGTEVVDSRNGISRPELDLAAAVSHVLATSGCAATELGTRLSGDFNGDGDDDGAVFTGSAWEVSLSNGSWFNAPATWASFSTKSGWTAHVAGDFNGDDRTDIANFNTSNGTVVDLQVERIEVHDIEVVGLLDELGVDESGGRRLHRRRQSRHRQLLPRERHMVGWSIDGLGFRHLAVVEWRGNRVAPGRRRRHRQRRAQRPGGLRLRHRFMESGRLDRIVVLVDAVTAACHPARIG